MTTPAAEAIRGLAEALRAIVGDGRTCISCGLPHAQCELHPAYCKPIIEARAALAAFENRQPLREDAAVLLALAHFVSDNLTAGEAADLIDAALFGPPTKEGSRG